MENASQALKMAGAVLLFVLALSVAIVSFGQVRETADTILDHKDREVQYIDGDEYMDYFYYKSTGTERSDTKTYFRYCASDTDSHFKSESLWRNTL